MIGRNQGRTLLALAAALLAVSCGAGVAGVAASSGSSGGGNSAPSIANLQVPVSRTSPARIHFELADREGETVRVELRARVPDAQGNLGAPELLTQLDSLDFPANGAAVAIPAGGQVEAIDVAWDFSAETFLAPADGHFVEGLQLAARLDNGTELVLGDDEPLSIGNDAPLVTAVTPIVPADEAEVAGIVRVEVSVADSSDDVVTVVAQFDIQGDVPDAGWQPATGFGLTDVQVARAGTTLDFFWDTDADLHDLERQVALRCTVTDSALAVGNTLASLSFRVDNNAAPIVQLDSGPLILNPDERRGIPIPFRVIDEEGDLVEVIFQWRREGEEFPSLDRDSNGTVENEEVDAILGDPVLRKEHHVCTEYPRYAKGRVVPIDEDTVRLPELASSESWILASGIVGKTLELLRPSSIPTPITPTWRSNPLVSPAAVLPMGDGLAALVLEGSGRLHEIELATGLVVRDVAQLGGRPTAMTLEHAGEITLIVASDMGSTWRLERIDLEKGAVTELFASITADEPPPVRGLASLGTHGLLLTAGSSLLHVDYQEPSAPRLTTLLPDLATPWGLIVDPLGTNRIYLSERDRDRVLAIDLGSNEKIPVVLSTAGLLGFEHPQALAFEDFGTRLLSVTSTPAGASRLTGLEIGARGGNVAFSIGAPRMNQVASLATGADGLRLLALQGSSEILVGGGVEQRRRLSFYETTGQHLTVDSPFDPAPSAGQVCRIRTEHLLRASAVGSEGSFLWSGLDLSEGGLVFLRSLARDDELGANADGAASKRVRGALDVAPLVLGGFSTTRNPFSVAAADLDGNGSLDLVSANGTSDNLTVFFQESPGSFALAPRVLGGSSTTNGAVSVAAADMDGDGDLDLGSANRDGDSLAIFFQQSSGSFISTPLVLGGSPTTDGPNCVEAADLDEDGHLDLVSANAGSDNLTIFFQQSPGTFPSAPLVLGGSPTTDAPNSVTAADMDRDGDLDLIAANAGSDNLTVFFQESPRIFASVPLALGGLPTMDVPVSVAAADLDGDGTLDLASSNAGSDNLTVFFQESPGTFATVPLALAGFPTTVGPVSVFAADLDGDGDLDLSSGNRGSDDLTVFFQESLGSFPSAPLVVGGLSATDGPFSVAADMNGDGRLDLLSANTGSNDLTVFLQAGPGAFTSAPLVLGGERTTDGPQSVAMADMDGDYDLDIVTNAGNKLAVFFQESPGSFGSTPLVLGGLPTMLSPRSVATADLDGDGDLDLVSANRSSDNLTVFFQERSGSFASSPLVLGGTGTTRTPDSVAVADLDGDGDLDLVSANEFVDSLTVFFQDSKGNFASVPLVLDEQQTMDSPRSVAAVDLDGDGDLDLVSANGSSDNLTVFFQESHGSFPFAPLVVGGFPTTETPLSVAAADFDGDGDFDLVSANNNSSNLTIFFQESPGSFASTPLTLGGLGTTTRPVSVAAADMDRDGDMDLVSVNTGLNNLTVFFQESPGSFGPEPLELLGTSSLDQPKSFAAADLDGDGDMDLVSANSSHTLTVFFGGR